jgi:hypothetical protein
VVASTLALTTLAAAAGAQDGVPLRGPGAPPVSAARWREAPPFVAVFAPRLYREAYRAFVTELDLDRALQLTVGDPAGQALAAPGAWRPGFENAVDAFGSGGTFDAGKLARLYGSRQARVARGPRGNGGRVEESWMLISPFPSPDCERLNTGTLLMILRVP